MLACVKAIILSSARGSVSTYHNKCKKHKEALKKRNTFFTPKPKKKSKSDIESSIVSNEHCFNSQSTMQQFVVSTETKLK